MTTPTQKIDVSLKTVLITIGVLLGLYGLFLLRQIFVLLFLAMIFMSALSPSVKWLEQHRRIPLIVGILMHYLFILGLLIFGIVLVFPPFLYELQNLTNTLSLPPLPDSIRNLNFSITDVSALANQLQLPIAAISRVLTSAFSLVFSFITVLVLTTYLLLERDRLYLRVKWFTTNSSHISLAKEFVDQMVISLGGWVRGQLTLMLIIGVATYAGLAILGVPYAIPLAIIAGVLEILPNLGPTLAAIPAISVAMVRDGWILAGLVLLFNILVQQLEANLIVPKVMKDNVDVNPLVTILVILIGLKLSGVIGAFLAVPTYIVVRTGYSIWRREFQKSTPTT